MRPIKWHGANKELEAAPGTEGFIQPLPVFTNGSVCVSCWQLDAAELQTLIDAIANNKPACLFVSIYYGQSQPPVYIGTEDDVRNQVADFGAVWKKE